VQYDGMPRSTIGTDVVDYVLPVAQMPEVNVPVTVSRACIRREGRLNPARCPDRAIEALSAIITDLTQCEEMEAALQSTLHVDSDGRIAVVRFLK